MHVLIPAVALAVFAVGCDLPQEKVTTAKDFLAKFQEAEKGKDGKVLWNLLSKDFRNQHITTARTELEQAKASPEAADRIKKEYGLKDDPAKMGEDKLAQAMVLKQLEKHPSDLLEAKFVEERPQGEQVVMVVDIPNKGKQDIILVKEEGSLKINLETKKVKEPKEPDRPVPPEVPEKPLTPP